MKIEKIIKELERRLYGREQEIRIGVLGLLTGKPVLFYGPPGTAKSLLARLLAEHIEKPQCGKITPRFEISLSNYSQPEQIFGPMDLAALKNSVYRHKVEGYLPNAHVVFLDEVFRPSQGGILDTLLTVMNEKKFQNGEEILETPWKVLFAACNDLPEQNSSQAAMLDRFPLRCPVHNVVKCFEDVQKISKKPCAKQTTRLSINDISNLPNCLPYRFECKSLIDEVCKEFQEKGYQISDRRWKKVNETLSVAAATNKREKIHLWDMFLLPYLLASNEEQFDFCKKLVEDTIFMDDAGFQKHLKDKNNLEVIVRNSKTLCEWRKGTIWLPRDEKERIYEKAKGRQTALQENKECQ